MSFWSAVVAIVAIIAFARIRMNRDSAGRHYHSAEQAPPSDAAYTASLEREVAELRKRLEVLERIATDENEPRRLAREIESLRDQ